MQPEQQENELATLEEPSTTVSGDSVQSTPGSESLDNSEPAPPTPKLPGTKLKTRLRILVARFNIYLLIFILLFVLAIVAIMIIVRNESSTTLDVESQTLSSEDLAKLRGTTARVGDPKQTLSIESNAVFTGSVLLRSNLDVAGTLKVGGSLNLPGITVAGTSTFDQIQANDLSVTGDTSIQGQLNAQSINVSGNGTFGGSLSAGQLNIQTLQLSGDLQLNRHIDAGGGTPSKSDGSALGGGGTTSISGSDTAGTATINTGGSPSAGCLITITFAQRFNGTPHVVITPVGSAGASLNYYVNRSNTNFSICTTNAPAGGSTFSFDYVAID